MNESVQYCIIMIMITYNHDICTLYQGRMQDFSGGGATLKFLVFFIYMSRAAKRQAFVRGLGACPPRKILKKVQFRAF